MQVILPNTKIITDRVSGQFITVNLLIEFSILITGTEKINVVNSNFWDADTGESLDKYLLEHCEVKILKENETNSFKNSRLSLLNDFRETFQSYLQSLNLDISQIEFNNQ